MAYYRGYILIRLKIIGKEWDVANKMKDMESTKEDEDWKVTYATPVYGGWDLIAEVSFMNLQELDKIVTYCRTDEEIGDFIEETTTLLGTKPNYPLEE